LVKDFSESEKKLREIISSSKSFTFEGEAFVPELVTKPVIEGGGGETQTVELGHRPNPQYFTSLEFAFCILCG